MKKLHIIFMSCLILGLAVGCTPEDEHVVEYDLADVELDMPANDGSAPVAEVDPNAPPPLPREDVEEKEEDGADPEGTVSPEKLELLISGSKSAEGDAGLTYVIQEAVENYFAEKKALPPNFGSLVESGHLERAPITPKGKKILINGQTLEVTIVDAEGGVDE
ncbi:MAG: hypothetical protein ACKVJX_08585 [Verrucomicrobiia bacterium]|jgi:hypothetical protein